MRPVPRLLREWPEPTRYGGVPWLSRPPVLLSTDTLYAVRYWATMAHGPRTTCACDTPAGDDWGQPACDPCRGYWTARALDALLHGGT